MSEGPTFEEPQPQLTCLAEDDVVARVHETKTGSESGHTVKRGSSSARSAAECDFSPPTCLSGGHTL